MPDRNPESVKIAALFVLIVSLALSGAAHAQQNGMPMPNVPPSAAAAVAPPNQEVMPGATPTAPNPSSPPPSSFGTSMAASGVNDYVLGVGDKLQITVFGEDDLSGEFQVSSTGTISMPLVGEIPAAGQTTSYVQAAIVSRLSNGYMKDPHVSLQVSSYRPFFIVGEVMKPGSYTYVNGMTVINAVALAGGYTYRADKDDIKLKHGGLQAQDKRVDETTPVMPGDVVTVPERFF
jgi:polysaccharide export outer membrane protein